MARTLRLPRRRPATIAIWRTVLFVAIFVAWAVGAASGAISPYILPGPWQVLQAAGQMLVSAEFWEAFGQTLLSWIVGLTITFVAGNVIGLLIGTSRWAVRFTRPVIDLMRSIPAVTLVPLAILLYGTSLGMKLILIIYGAIWEVIVQAIYAARQVDPVASDTMRVYSVRGWIRVRALLLPSSAPFIATGIRVSAVLSFLLSIGAELVGGAPGIGRSLELAHEAGNFSEMWVYIFVAAAFGIALNLVLTRLDRRVLRGHPGYRGELQL